MVQLHVNPEPGSVVKKVGRFDTTSIKHYTVEQLLRLSYTAKSNIDVIQVIYEVSLQQKI